MARVAAPTAGLTTTKAPANDPSGSGMGTMTVSLTIVDAPNRISVSPVMTGGTACTSRPSMSW